MLKSLRITDIKVSSRHRKDMGDLTSLAESIRQNGLLQPISVTEKLELVFGERRLRAHKDTDKPDALIDDFSHDWQDWWLLSDDNREHWQYSTR